MTQVLVSSYVLLEYQLHWKIHFRFFFWLLKFVPDWIFFASASIPSPNAIVTHIFKLFCLEMRNFRLEHLIKPHLSFLNFSGSRMPQDRGVLLAGHSESMKSVKLRHEMGFHRFWLSLRFRKQVGCNENLYLCVQKLGKSFLHVNLR